MLKANLNTNRKLLELWFRSVRTFFFLSKKGLHANSNRCCLPSILSFFGLWFFKITYYFPSALKFVCFINVAKSFKTGKIVSIKETAYRSQDLRRWIHRAAHLLTLQDTPFCPPQRSFLGTRGQVSLPLIDNLSS